MEETSLESSEEWRVVPGYEGKYEVSSIGRVKSLPMEVKRPNGSIQHRGASIHKPQLHRQGYIRVSLIKEYRNHQAYVHRLVALAFIPNPDNLPEVNHKDGVKDNNAVDNLEWSTSSQNTIHSFSTGLNPLRFREESPNYQGEIQVLKDGEVVLSLHGKKDVIDNGFNYVCVRNVVRGVQKTHQGYTFIKETK